ncbi:MAG TPA: hypothetical protein VE258_13690, partial [Ktedonobacterales bacterium]|nr:hypothetical protein [Ktedonobacterales bacterium]
MMWLTWRQHRIEAAIVGGALAVLAVLLLVTGYNMASDFQRLSVADCVAHPDHQSCESIVGTFRGQYESLVYAVQWLNLIPVLVGILIGAPLVARELEHGTHRLVWTQAATRLRWLTVKLLLILGGCLLVSAALTALLTWWYGPFDVLDGHLRPAGFDFQGTAPFGYMAFALALAIAAGTLLRRAIPGMAVTLAGFLAVRLPIEFYLRPRYQQPITVSWDPIGSGPTLKAGDWVVSNGFLDHLGQKVSPDTVFAACLPSSGGPALADKLSV